MHARGSLQVAWSLRLYLLLACLSLPNSYSIGDEVTLNRLRHEAPAAWKRIRDAYVGKQFSIRRERINSVSVSKFPQPIVVSEERHELLVARLEGGMLIRRKLNQKKPKVPPTEIRQSYEMVETTSEGMELLNDYYSGVISGDSPPGMDSFVPLRNDDESNKTKLELDYETMSALRIGNGLLDRSIVGFPGYVSVAGKANYVITDADEFTSDDGDVLVKVTLGIGILKNGELVSTSPHFVEGIVVLDPSRDWCLVEYHHKFDNSGSNPDSTQDVVAEFGRADSSFQPVRIESKNSFSDGPTWTIAESFTELKDTDVTTDECYFSAYGLPEPEGIEMGRKPWIVTFVLLVAIAVLSIAVIRRGILARGPSQH